jgi:hypothetical protein
MAAQSSLHQHCPVAESILRSHQICAGRRLVGLALGLSFLLLGGGALIKQGSQGLVNQPVESQAAPMQ